MNTKKNSTPLHCTILYTAWCIWQCNK